jgi:transposase-like protein
MHSQQEPRVICTPCRKTLSATKGTAFYHLRTSAETVTRVVMRLAHGCPPHAIIAAFGFDERPVARWMARAGV